MKRIARWSVIFLLLCSIIWVGTASAAMIVKNNMSALGTLNTINKNQTPQGKENPLERLAKEIGAGLWDDVDWDDPDFQDAVKNLGVTVVKKDEQPPESFVGDAILDHLGDTEFNVPEMNGNLLILGGLNGNIPSGQIDRLYVLSDEDVRLNIGAAAEIQELILGASGNVELTGEGNVGSTIVLDTPKNLGIGMATNLINLSDDPLMTGDIVLNPGKNVLVPNQQIDMGDELKVEKKISLTVRFRLVDQSARDMELDTADWDGALLTEATVQYTGDNSPMATVNMMDSIEAAFAEKYPDLQEQYVLLPEMRSADPWSKVYRLNDGESCFAVTENDVYLSRTGDVVFPLTDESTLVAEFPVYVYRFGEQDGRITYRLRISGARPDYFMPSLTLRSGGKAEFTFDKESGEWVTGLRRSDFGENERDRIILTGLRGEETDAFLTVTGRENPRIVTLTWTADTQRTTIDAQNVLWSSDETADGNDLLCRAGEPVTVRFAPAAGYRGINVALSDPKIAFAVSEENDAISFLMPYAPLTLTLTANQIYTVTLDTNGGDPLTPLNYTIAESLPLPTLTREGYTFLGWTGEGIDTPQLTVEIPVGSTGHRHYKANWQTIPYIITFDTNGGEPLDAISYTVEDEITLPIPVRAGYDFVGWTDAESGEMQNAAIPKGTMGDKAYIAGWKAKEYTITLETNGGDPVPTIRYTVEDEITLPKPIRTGYLFVGWTGYAIGEAQENVVIPRGSMGDRTYTANWQVIEYSITLLDADGAGTSDKILYTVEDGIVLSSQFLEGYDFLGWTGEDIVTPQITITIPKGTTGDKTYTANWKAITYTITLGANGGEKLDAIKYTIKSADILLPTPKRTGYEFKGWVGDGISGAQTEVIIPTGSTGDKAYIATWRVIEYIIELRHSSGDWMQNIVYTVEKEVTLPIPTRDGYKFIGWVGEDIINPQEKVTIPRGSTGFKRYAAHWAMENYTITLDTNGGDALDAISYKVTSDPITLPTPTREGYTFKGWTGAGISEPQTIVTVPTGSTGDRTYTANWKATEYTIMLLKPDGSVLEKITYTIEAAVEIDADRYTPDAGEVYVGWLDYVQNELPKKFSVPVGTTGDKYYSVRSVRLFTITLDTNGGDAIDSISYTMESDAFDLPIPTRKGYKFTGWTLNGSDGEPQTTVTIPTGTKGNKAYTANWRLITYNLRIVCINDDTSKTLNTVDVQYAPDTPLPVQNIDGYELMYFTADGEQVESLSKDFFSHYAYRATCNAYYTPLYTIAFDTTGGDPLPTIRYSKYTAPFTLPIPTREGYEFSGWLNAYWGWGETGVKNATIDPSKQWYQVNYTCRARWWEIHSITLDTNGGDPLAPLQYKYLEGFYSGISSEEPIITLPIPTREGYDFVGWTGVGFSTPTKNLTVPARSTGDLTYTAHWTPSQYTISLDLNGGEGQTSVKYTVDNEDFDLPNPMRDGYTFKGWTGEGISEPQTTVTIPKGTKGNKAYTANWELTQYTLTLKDGKHTPTGSVPCEESDLIITFTIEDEIHLPQGVQACGHECRGWRLDGTREIQRNVVIPRGTTQNLTYWYCGDRGYEPTPGPLETPTPTPAPTETATPAPTTSELPPSIQAGQRIVSAPRK